MTIRPLALLAALLISASPACTSNDLTGGGGGGGGGSGGPAYSFTARTNSADWAATTFAATMAAGGNPVDIAGTQVTDTLEISISLRFTNFRGVGIYPLAAPGSSGRALVEYTPIPLTTGDNGLYTTSATATGTATITSFNAHTGYVQGTFAFTTVPSGVPGPDAPDTVGVTQGHFTGVIVQ